MHCDTTITIKTTKCTVVIILILQQPLKGFCEKSFCEIKIITTVHLVGFNCNNFPNSFASV